MVSLQSLNDHRTAILEPENSIITPQKRKAFEGLNRQDYMDRPVSEKRPKAEYQNFMADIELHLETPLPSEWQRCLDIQSGKIHFYNTKTHARTSTDPRKNTPDDYYNHDHHHQSMSLDLELNLTTSQRPSTTSFARKENNHNNATTSSSISRTSFCRDLSIDQTAKQKTALKSGGTSPPAWLAAEAERRQEMVAAVCVRCHMLVMLCRSSPACPNCKFVHPPEKSPSASFVHVKL